MAGTITSVAFKNGYSMPIVGLGTWKSNPGEVTRAVKEAISCGYRHFDCAKLYGNEKEVGAALQEKIQDGTVKREDLFITSKLWITYTRKELVKPSLLSQLQDLGLDYLDLYLLHWPVAFKEGDVMLPRDADGNIIFNSNDFVDTWKGIEQCLREGLVRSIGVSNFNKRQLERLLKEADIPPVNNQIECHPYLSQKKLINFCKSNGITVTAYSPLGSPDRPVIDEEQPILLENSVLKKLAAKYNKSPAQILIRYHIENGTAVVPKSVTPSRIRSNYDVFDFSLTDSEMKSLEALNADMRYIAFEMSLGHPEYPFSDEF